MGRAATREDEEAGEAVEDEAGAAEEAGDGGDPDAGGAGVRAALRRGSAGRSLAAGGASLRTIGIEGDGVRSRREGGGGGTGGGRGVARGAVERGGAGERSISTSPSKKSSRGSSMTSGTRPERTSLGPRSVQLAARSSSRTRGPPSRETSSPLARGRLPEGRRAPGAGRGSLEAGRPRERGEEVRGLGSCRGGGGAEAGAFLGEEGAGGGLEEGIAAGRGEGRGDLGGAVGDLIDGEGRVFVDGARGAGGNPEGGGRRDGWIHRERRRKGLARAGATGNTELRKHGKALSSGAR